MINAIYSLRLPCEPIQRSFSTKLCFLDLTALTKFKSEHVYKKVDQGQTLAKHLIVHTLNRSLKIQTKHHTKPKGPFHSLWI